MNKQQKNLVKENILKARAILEEDIADRLIRFGITKDPSKWLAVDKLKHLSSEDMLVRKNLIAAIEKLEQGISKKEAYEQYIKEVVFTYVNRLAALRVLEVRGIIPTILEIKSEYGGRSPFYRDYFEVAGELCNSPDKGWQILLRLIFEEISTEIKVLFDPDDEYSIIFPSNQAISEIIRLFTELITRDIWSEDEIIGWIYQYFNSKEKDEVFENLYKRKIKINSRTLPAATQLFTPKWIVKYLVDNTLGAFWIEMHPNSKIKEHCTYYIKPEELMKRDVKKVSDIKVLDPACGSGHFLLQAFDILYKMYLEEGLVAEKDIPAAILANNLYGIDIDLRAIQLTALTLFTKAKSYNKKAEIKQINVVAADAILKNDDNKEKLIKKIKTKLPGAEHLVETIWDSFANIREYGSLLRIENEIKNVVDEERAKQKNTKLEQFEEIRKTKDQETIIGFLSSDKYWQQVQDSLIEEVKTIAKESLKATDISQSMFAAEAEKTMHLLDFFFQRYDIVVTNPPYLHKRGMSEKVNKYLKMQYEEGSSDLYAAFILRSIDLLQSNGLLGMITQDTFMFIPSFTKLREIILKDCHIDTMLHLGPHAFEEIQGEKVRSTLFSIRKTELQMNSIFINLTKSQDKQNDFQDIQNMSKKENLFFINQKEFNFVIGSPFDYWISKTIRDIFKISPSFDNFAEPKAGSSTADNDYFLKYYWEINYKDSSNWKKYVKGDSNKFYYDSIIYVNWKDNAQELRNHAGTVIASEKYFHEEGITFSLISSNGFTSRYLGKDSMFDHGANAIYNLKEGIFYTLGYLNSKMVNYFLNILNPTLNYQAGDVRKLPFIKPTTEIKSQVELASRTCYDNLKSIYESVENSLQFKPDTFIKGGSVKEHVYKILRSRELKEIINLELLFLIDDEIFLLHKINQNDRNSVLSETTRSPCSLPLLACFTDLDSSDFPKILIDVPRSVKESYELNYRSDTEIIELVKKNYSYKTIELISNDLGISPISIWNIIKKEYITPENLFTNEVENIISYLTGLIFNRWQHSSIVPDEDGILSFDPTRKDYIVKRIRDALEVIFGVENVDKREREITEAIGKELDKYFLNDFFKSHCKKYKKRPIYWHIQSPNKYFNCLLYYHKLDTDTIYKIKSHYVEEKMVDVEHEIRGMVAKINSEENEREKAKLQKELSELQSEKEDLETVSKLLQEIIDEGYTPNIDDGVKANILPFVKRGLIQLDLKLEKEESSGAEE